jgi:predicted HicB family RNase H-like nuclease
MSDTMTYKGYIGSVHFSEDDEVFYGKIEAINDLVMFEGESVKKLKGAFHEAVDDYLETCEEMGREPQKTFKGSFNVRIDPEIHRQLAVKAAIAGISLNQFVQKALESAVAEKSY